MASTTNTTSAAPDTMVSINGKSYDLRSLVASSPEEIAAANERGLELYNALPAEFKAKADMAFRVAMIKNKIIEITGEAGGKTTFERYCQWVKDGAEAGANGADAAMRTLHKKVKEATEPYTPTSVKVAGGAADFLTGVMHGGWTGFGRLKDAAISAAQGAPDIESIPGLAFNSITEEQARTFSAAYGAILCDQSQRDAKAPTIDWPWAKGGSKIFNNFSATFTAGLRWIGHLIQNAWNAVTGKEHFQWPSFGELFTEERFIGDNRALAAKMTAIGPIAGIDKSGEITRALGGSVIVDNQGNLQAVTSDSKGIKLEQVKDEKGAPLTLQHKVVNEAKAKLTEGQEGASTAYKVGDVVGVAAAGSFGVATLVRTPTILRGIRDGFQQAYENAPLNRALANEAKAAAQAAGSKWYDPRTWFRSEAGAEMREAIAQHEMNEAQRRTDTQGHQLKARADAMEAFAEKPLGIRGRITNFCRHPFQSMGETVGSFFGKTGDSVVRNVVEMGHDAKSVLSGVSETLPGVGKTMTRAASFVRGGGRALGAVGVVAGSAADGYDIYDGIHTGDGHKVAKSSGSLVGGIAGGSAGLAGGAAAGAAIGVWFGGVGAIPGAIIGGGLAVIGAGIGGWLGSKAGGAAVDYVAGDALDGAMHKGPAVTSQSAESEQTVANAGIAAMGGAISGAQGLTPHETISGLDTVVQQARMAVNRGTGSETKLDNFNLGMKVTSVAMGSTVAPGSSGNATQPAATLQPAV